MLARSLVRVTDTHAVHVHTPAPGPTTTRYILTRSSSSAAPCLSAIWSSSAQKGTDPHTAQFINTGLVALRDPARDRCALDPARYGHVRRELGLEVEAEETAAGKGRGS